MPYIIIIEKLGNVKEMNIKEYKESELFKKANFKSPEGFMCHTKWQVQKNIEISVYGKTTGKAGQENKYDFPPPIDSLLLYGGCVLTKFSTEKKNIMDLRLSDWNATYDKLMGGFEDLEGTEEEEEEEEDLEQDGIKLSKEGYVCDGFIVEDDEDKDYDNLSLDDDDEEENIVKQVKKKPIKKCVKRKPNKKNTAELIVDPMPILNCESELSEEEYL